MSTLNDDGSIHETWQPDRSEQWAISKPHWLMTIFTRTLPCGCTQRRITRRITLYVWRCPTHMAWMDE
jgi:hypothetical protein